MSYSQEVYEAAERELAARRAAAERTALQKKQEIYLRLPEVEEIDRELAASVYELARIAFGKVGDVRAETEKVKNRNLFLQEKRKHLLQTAGYAADATEPRYRCPQCEDTGYVGSRRCACMEQQLQRETANRLTGSSLLQSCTFENFSLDYYPGLPGEKGSPREIMSRVLQSCRRYAEGFSASSGNLLMCGGTGLGKTHLSMAIAGKVIRAGYSVIYTPAQAAFRQLMKELYAREDDTLSALQSCDLLILDDLGAEAINSVTVSQLCALADARLLAGKPFVINTNFGVNELEKTYGQRLTSRLLGTSCCLSFAGSDIRIRKAQERMQEGTIG